MIRFSFPINLLSYYICSSLPAISVIMKSKHSCVKASRYISDAANVMQKVRKCTIIQAFSGEYDMRLEIWLTMNKYSSEQGSDNIASEAMTESYSLALSSIMYWKLEIQSWKDIMYTMSAVHRIVMQGKAPTRSSEGTVSNARVYTLVESHIYDKAKMQITI